MRTLIAFLFAVVLFPQGGSAASPDQIDQAAGCTVPAVRDDLAWRLEDATRYRHPTAAVDANYWTIRAAGWPPEAMEFALKTIGRESGGDPTVVGEYGELGQWQIYPKVWAEEGRQLGYPPETWTDPRIAAEFALHVFAVQGPGAWNGWKAAGRPSPNLTRTAAAWLFEAARQARHE